MCQESWISFRSMLEHHIGDVSEQRNRHAVETTARNRKVLLSILDVVVTLGRQGLAFRGHRDSRKDRFNQGNNMGNFYEILQMRARSKCNADVSCSKLKLLDHAMQHFLASDIRLDVIIKCIIVFNFAQSNIFFCIMLLKVEMMFFTNFRQARQECKHDIV